MQYFRLSTAALVIGLWAGCDSGPTILSYEEFQAQAYREPETGLRILDGDQLVETDEAMAALYDSYLESVAAAADRAAGLATVQQGLAINLVNGQDDKWPATTAAHLTYCISSSSFGSQYNTIVSAIAAAVVDWQNATANRVQYIHATAQDSDCTSRNTGVVFNVRQVTSSQYLARSFFPSSARKDREILVSTSAFGNIWPWTLTGVFRHELGHTLGFRHEHTRPEAGTCFEDTSWRALTAYDASSVMHYPRCNGTQTGDLVLTNLDKSGAASVY